MYLLEFSPDESFVAAAQWLDNTVNVFNTRFGNQPLVIDTSIQICGMKMTESTIIIVGDQKIVTWDLPAEDCVLNVRRNIDDSVQTTTFEHPESIENLHASISPDLNYIAFGSSECLDLWLYDMHTREQLAAAESYGWLPGFTLSGHEVCCAVYDDIVDWWAIVKEDGSNVTKLEHLMEADEPLGGSPWQSSHGYQVTDDGWILNFSGKWLLWLPHHWQATKMERRWSGKFLAVQNSELPEAIILELEV